MNEHPPSTGPLSTGLRKSPRFRPRGAHSRNTVTFGDPAEPVTKKKLRAPSLGGLLVLWWYITRGPEPILDEKTFPSPVVIWDAFVEWWQDGYRRTSAWEHASASLSRVLKGMVIGTVIGIPVGFAMGLSRIKRGIFDPIVE